MRNIGHFVGGREIPGQSGRVSDVFQPMTGEVIAQVALASRDEVRRRSRTPRPLKQPGAPPTRSAAPA